MLRKTTLIVASLGVLAAPANGQVQVGLSAFGGGYVPVSELFDQIPLGTGGPVILNLGQEPGFLAGGRLTLWFSRLGVEAEAGYVFSKVDLPDRVVEAGLTDDGEIFMGSLNVMYVLFEAPFSPLSVHVSGGGGFVSRTGDFFAGLDDTTSLAGALGFGIRFGLGRVVRLRFDVKDYISSFAPTTRAGDEIDSKIQNELIGTLGLEFVLSPGS